MGDSPFILLSLQESSVQIQSKAEESLDMEHSLIENIGFRVGYMLKSTDFLIESEALKECRGYSLLSDVSVALNSSSKQSSLKIMLFEFIKRPSLQL